MTDFLIPNNFFKNMVYSLQLFPNANNYLCWSVCTHKFIYIQHIIFLFYFFLTSPNQQYKDKNYCRLFFLFIFPAGSYMVHDIAMQVFNQLKKKKMFMTQMHMLLFLFNSSLLQRLPKGSELAWQFVNSFTPDSF